MRDDASPDGRCGQSVMAPLKTSARIACGPFWGRWSIPSKCSGHQGGPASRDEEAPSEGAGPAWLRGLHQGVGSGLRERGAGPALAAPQSGLHIRGEEFGLGPRTTESRPAHSPEAGERETKRKTDGLAQKWDAHAMSGVLRGTTEQGPGWSRLGRPSWKLGSAHSTGIAGKGPPGSVHHMGALEPASCAQALVYLCKPLVGCGAAQSPASPRAVMGSSPSHLQAPTLLGISRALSHPQPSCPPDLPSSLRPRQSMGGSAQNPPSHLPTCLNEGVGRAAYGVFPVLPPKGQTGSDPALCSGCVPRPGLVTSLHHKQPLLSSEAARTSAVRSGLLVTWCHLSLPRELGHVPAMDLSPPYVQ